MMIEDPASLDRLRDIAEPAAVSWWPLAPGWWVILAFVAIAIVFFTARIFLQWKANAYRRAALRELETLTTVTEIHQLLKRTAIAAFPRDQVASLSGQAWCDWLGRTANIDLSPSFAQMMAVGVYRDARPSDPAASERAASEGAASERGETARFAADWIKHHQSSQMSESPC
jgi:hypothetical protein